MPKITKAVIPAAGLGTRLLPITKSMPKEMLPLVDKPVIQCVVEEAVSAGLEDIIIITGRGKRAIEDHFDRNIELEEDLRSKDAQNMLAKLEKIESMADIHYIRQKEPLGLGHAVLCAKKHVGGEPFVVLLGDVVVTVGDCTRPLVDLFSRFQKTVIAVEEVERGQVSEYGIVGGKKIGHNLVKVDKLVEKPHVAQAPSNLAIFGRYAFPPEIFDCLEGLPPGKNDEIQLTDGIARLAQGEDVYAYTITKRRYDIGKKLNYFKAFVEFGLDMPDIGPAAREYLKSLKL